MTIHPCTEHCGITRIATPQHFDIMTCHEWDSTKTTESIMFFSSQVSETEIFIEDCEFKFYSKPYYLRYALPLHMSCLIQALPILTIHDSLKCSYEVVVLIIPIFPSVQVVNKPINKLPLLSSLPYHPWRF